MKITATKFGNKVQAGRKINVMRKRVKEKNGMRKVRHEEKCNEKERQEEYSEKARQEG
jgi:hypothetical protein